ATGYPGYNSIIPKSTGTIGNIWLAAALDGILRTGEISEICINQKFCIKKLKLILRCFFYAYLLRKSGVKNDWFRICGRVSGRAVAGLQGRTAAGCRLREGVRREGVRREDGSARAGQGAQATGVRRCVGGDPPGPPGEVDTRPSEHPRCHRQGRCRIQVA